MTDQYQWQSALAAAEHAIDTEQIKAAEGSLRIALTQIGTYEPNDPARLPILAAFIRCCERAIERDAEQSILAMRQRATEVQRVMARAGEYAPLTLRQAAAQLPDELAALRKQGKLSGRLRNSQTSAHYMLLDSQIVQLGEDSAGVVSTLLQLEQLEWVHAGHEDDAFALLQRALAIRERTLGSEHPDTLYVLWRLGSRYDTYTSGSVVMNMAFRPWRCFLGGTPVCGHWCDHRNGDERGNRPTSYAWAMPLWQRLLAYVEHTGPLDFGRTRYDVPELLLLLGKAYNGLRLYGEAKEVWKRYLKLTEDEPQQTDNRLPPMKLRRLSVYYSIGHACLAQNDWAEAVGFLALAIESHRTIQGFTVRLEDGPAGIDLSSGMAAYAKALSNADRQDKAIPLFEEAIALNYNTDYQYVELLHDYAATLRASGDTATSAGVEDDAAALLESIEAKERRRDAITAALPEPEQQ